MKKNILLFIYLLCSTVLFSQTNNCLAIYDDGNKFCREGKYDKAMERLKQLENCDYKNALISQRNSLQDAIFAAIIKQKIDALTDKKKAEEAKDEAYTAKKAAEDAQKDAEKATKEAIAANAKSDSIKINQYNKSIAYNTIQTDPTLAWNIISTLDNNLASMKDITYTLTTDAQTEFYKKTVTTAGIVRAIGWQSSTNNASILLIATNDGLLRYWNTEGVLQDSLVYQKDNALCAISKDGRYMLSANADSTFAIWDLRTHESITHKHVGAPIAAVAISNANTYFAIASDDFFEVYDRKEKLVDRTALDTLPQTIAVSENGTVVVGFDKAPSQFFQLNRGIKIYPEKAYLRNVAFHAACFVDNTDQVLMGLQNSFNAQLSNLDDNKAETPSSNYPIIGHSNGVMSVGVSKNSDYLATGSQDKTVILWQKQDGHYHESVILKGHDNTVEQLAFSQNAQYIASATVNEVKIWLIHCREIAKTPVGTSTYFSLTYLPNAKDSILAGDGVGNIHLINTQGNILKQWRNSTAKINTLAAFIENDTMTKPPTPIMKFISGSEDGKVSIWQLKNTQPDNVLLYESEDKKPVSVRAIALHNRERDFFIAYADGKVIHRNIKGDSLSAHDYYLPITKIKIVKKSLFIGYENGIVMHVSTQDYSPLSDDLMFDAHVPIHSLAVSHRGRYVAAGSEHNLKIWDLENPNLVIKPIREAHNNQISDLQFSSNDTYLFSAGWDKTAYMWLREGYKLSKFYQVSDIENGSMASLAVGPKDSVFVTGSGLASFWRTPQSLAAEAIEKRTDIHKFVLMPIAFYKASKDLTVLEEAARKFAEIESYQQADMVFKLTSKVIEDSLKKIKKLDDVANELNLLRRNINIDRCLLLDEKYNNKNAFDKLVNDCRDTTDLAYYSGYFFEQKMWRNLESACLKYQKLAKLSDIDIVRYLYVANVELNEGKQALILPPFSKLTDKENLTLLRNFFKNLSAKTSDVQIYQKIEYAKTAYVLSQKKLDNKVDAQYLEAYLEDIASDNISYHWSLIQKGDMKKAKEVIEEGFKRLKGRETAQRLASSYGLMRMNYGHTLLFTGQIAEARNLINALANVTFVDNRYPTFRQAYLDDFKDIEKYNVVAGGKVIPKEYRDHYLDIKAGLMNESIELVQSKTPLTPVLDKNTEGVSEPVQSSDKKYFVIVGSFKAQKEAQTEITRVKKWKSLHLKIVLQNEKYRIVALNTAEEKEAEDYKKMLYDKFKIDAWVYEQK